MIEESGRGHRGVAIRMSWRNPSFVGKPRDDPVPRYVLVSELLVCGLRGVATREPECGGAVFDPGGDQCGSLLGEGRSVGEDPEFHHDFPWTWSLKAYRASGDKVVEDVGTLGVVREVTIEWEADRTVTV